MEKEKVKETFWTIHSRNKSQSIELQYTELTGVPQSITIVVNSKDIKASIEMTPSEFQKTYLILRSFHDLLLSSDTTNIPPVFNHEPLKNDDDDYELHQDRKINTDEWDPW